MSWERFITRVLGAQYEKRFAMVRMLLFGYYLKAQCEWNLTTESTSKLKILSGFSKFLGNKNFPDSLKIVCGKNATKCHQLWEPIKIKTTFAQQLVEGLFH